MSGPCGNGVGGGLVWGGDGGMGRGGWGAGGLHHALPAMPLYPLPQSPRASLGVRLSHWISCRLLGVQEVRPGRSWADGQNGFLQLVTGAP